MRGVHLSTSIVQDGMHLEGDGILSYEGYWAFFDTIVTRKLFSRAQVFSFVSSVYPTCSVSIELV